MNVGYARVSSVDQNLDLQVDALEKHGCDKIFTDHVSGAKADRPGLEKALEYVREGDKLVVWRLDRLGRSLQHLIKLVNELREQGVDLVVLQESIDTSTPTGRMTFHIFGAIAEFERELIRERTQAGLASARSRGNKGGRPSALDPQMARDIATLVQANPETPVADICRRYGISRSTFYRHVQPLTEDR